MNKLSIYRVFSFLERNFTLSASISCRDNLPSIRSLFAIPIKTIYVKAIKKKRNYAIRFKIIRPAT